MRGTTLEPRPKPDRSAISEMVEELLSANKRLAYEIFHYARELEMQLPQLKRHDQLV